MAEIYTFCKAYGNSIFYRGWKDGRQIIDKDASFRPSYYIKSTSDDNSDWTSLYGSPLSEVQFDSIRSAKEFVKKYDRVTGFEIHGDIEYHYQYLAKRFPGEVTSNLSQMGIWFIDIETVDVDGQSSKFPDIRTANHDVVLISVHDKNKNTTVVFGWRAVQTRDPSFEYRLFDDEKSMLIAFITYWQQNYPDIYSGWNCTAFDTPYLVNRIARVLGDDWVKKLSPFGMVHEKIVNVNGKEVQTYEIVGIVELDYLDLYKKYGTYSQKESFALGAIAQDELGETKLENPGKDFRDFYLNFYDTFVRYNAKDSLLVHRMDNKLKLIDLAVSVAYLAKSNIRDCLGVVKIWDVFIYNHLLGKKIAIPPFVSKLSGEFEGAYVKDVNPGMYGWTLTFDFKGLYPHIMMQWNISPETLVSNRLNVTQNMFLHGSLPDFPEEYSLAANGTMYRKNARGIIPEVASIVVNGRNAAKNEMLALQKELADIERKIESYE